jgi:hypothetical protein
MTAADNIPGSDKGLTLLTKVEPSFKVRSEAMKNQSG